MTFQQYFNIVGTLVVEKIVETLILGNILKDPNR